VTWKKLRKERADQKNKKGRLGGGIHHHPAAFGLDRGWGDNDNHVCVGKRGGGGDEGGGTSQKKLVARKNMFLTKNTKRGTRWG